MARWKLMAAHYLNLVQPAEWEYVEVSNGKHQRKRFSVPRMLNPNDPGDWNSRWGARNTASTVGNEDGEVIVCLPGKGQPGDYEFLGDPTPDMMPQDDEASEISGAFTDRWRYKPDDADVSFSTSLIDGIKEAMEERVPETVKIEGLDQILTTLAQSQKLMADLVASQHSARRT